MSSPLADELHNEPGEILGGAAALNFPPVNEERPLIVCMREDVRPSGRTVQKIEVRQPHPEGREWTTLQFPIEGQSLLDFRLEFKARVMPGSKFYFMAYVEDKAHQIATRSIGPHEAVYRISGSLPFDLVGKSWELGLTLPGKTWFAFQIWDIALTWHSHRED